MHRILFLDIETVPLVENFDELSENLQQYWIDKAKKISARDEVVDEKSWFRERAGIYSEYGKVVCISVGFLFGDDNRYLRIKSFANDDEKVLLEEFKVLVNKFFVNEKNNFCGHNIKEFDIPYICRRMIINGIQLPKSLQLYNKKPWEVQLLDTMDFWKFGDYKSYTSLKLLAEILGIPTPKDDIDGSMVAAVYYDEKNLDRIATYCEKDVIATVQVWLKINNKPIIEKENIKIVK